MVLDAPGFFLPTEGLPAMSGPTPLAEIVALCQVDLIAPGPLHSILSLNKGDEGRSYDLSHSHHMVNNHLLVIFLPSENSTCCAFIMTKQVIIKN